jgi:antitoxin component YwqK of YwqJK toxin-antitoxin module
MKVILHKTCLLIFILLIKNTTLSQINNVKFTTLLYENGVISAEGMMVDGKPDGYWRNYYPSGKLKNEGNRKNKELDSVWKFYTESGKIQKTYNYNLGKKNGSLFTYDTTGKISFCDNFINDIRSGKSYSYYNSGCTHFVVPYINGRADGEAIEYSEDSVKIGITIYKSGFVERYEKINRTNKEGKKQDKWIDFFEDGSVKKETNFRDGEIDGYIKEYDRKGNIIKTEKYFGGKKIEHPKELRDIKFYKEYYSNRNIKFEGGFIDGFPQGFHYYYNINNTIDSVLYYSDGFCLEKGKADTLKNKTGDWIEFYTTGEKKGKGKYTTGKKTGEWKYYYGAGNIEQTGKYSARGLPEGDWRWLYESGKTLREETYLQGKRNGTLTDYYEDGKIITKGEYINDLQEGKWEYQIGNYKEEGSYSLGVRDGLWSAWWTTTAKLRYQGNWLAGDPDGKHTWYFENEKKMMEGIFLGGQRNGDWKFYNEDGGLFLVITYENDVEVKFDGIKIYPTYEEAMSIFDNFKPVKK